MCVCVGGSVLKGTFTPEDRILVIMRVFAIFIFSQDAIFSEKSVW